MKSENNSEPWVNLKNIESEPRSSKERCSGRLSIYVNRVHNVDEVKLVNAHICNLPGTLEVGRTVHVSHVGGKVETNTAPEVLSQEDNILLGPEVGAGKSSPQEDIIVQPDFRPPVLTLTSCPEGPLIHDSDIDNLKNLLERDPTPWVGLFGTQATDCTPHHWKIFLNSTVSSRSACQDTLNSSNKCIQN
jgi:hypothetical protein